VLAVLLDKTSLTCALFTPKLAGYLPSALEQHACSAAGVWASASSRRIANIVPSNANSRQPGWHASGMWARPCYLPSCHCPGQTWLFSCTLGVGAHHTCHFQPLLPCSLPSVGARNLPACTCILYTQYHHWFRCLPSTIHS